MERCQNQTIQKNTYPVTTVVEDIKLNRALRLYSNVKGGTKIIEYVGLYISKAQYSRYKEQTPGTWQRSGRVKYCTLMPPNTATNHGLSTIPVFRIAALILGTSTTSRG
jgi:hypothetical protein